MTSAIGSDAPTTVCPYLGLIDNADSHANYATDAHRCYRLDNPTRIAAGHQETYCLGANHTTCPVYKGEGTTPARPAAGAGRTRPPATTEAESQPQPRGRTPTPRPSPDRPLKQGSIGPRAGGLSMPVATVGFFALAVVLILLAVWISTVVGGGGDDTPVSPGDATATAARGRTPTPGTTTAPTQSGTATATPNAATRTAIGSSTATTTGTARATTTATPVGAGNTYTVKAGDFCGTIADDHNITVDQLLLLNPNIDADCSNLQVGQVVKVK